MTTHLRSLVAKLDVSTRKAMESAANVALSRTHHEVDIEHVLSELLDAPDADLLRILKAYHVDVDRLQTDLETALERFRTGNTRNPVLSRNILRWLEAAWLAGSVNYGAERLGSGLLLLVLVADEELRRLLAGSCAALNRIPADDLKETLPALLRQTGLGASSDENESAGSEAGETGEPIKSRGTPNLDKYTIDLSAQARAGKIDPVLGRDGEIRQMIDILLRRRQNNPILTGEPGVGKTAVVEGLALRIFQGDVPDVLRNVTLRTLDLGLLQAGASVKGEFENRLRMHDRRNGGDGEKAGADNTEGKTSAWTPWGREHAAAFLKESIDQHATDHSTIMCCALNAEKVLAYDIPVGAATKLTSADWRDLRIAADWRLGEGLDKAHPHVKWRQYFDSGLWGDEDKPLPLHEHPDFNTHANPSAMPAKIVDERSMRPVQEISHDYYR